jgi:DNA polymerase elongation subunit (family B)
VLSEIVSAFAHGGEVHLVGPGGERDSVRAEHASFLRESDVDDELGRFLARLPTVVATARDRGFVRVSWRDWESRRLADEAFAKRGLRHFEADVSPVKRVLADSPIKICRPRVAYLDIETDSRLPFSRKLEMRVLSWCVVREDGKRRIRCLAEESDRAERELLAELRETLKAFDVAVAWYGGNGKKGHGFDFPVLDARAEHCGARWRDRRHLTIDFKDVWEKMNRMAAESGDEKESLALESVAQAKLGEGKEKTPADVAEKFGNKSMGALTYPMWAAGGRWRELMLEYMAKDTDLMRKLEAKAGYLSLFFAVCEATNCLPETRSLMTTAQMDGYLLRHGAERGIRWPSKTAGAVRAAEQYAGAIVMKPAARGIEKDVHVLDFKGMYPSIMISFNMSPETIVGADYRGEVATAPTGARFRLDEKGILTGALERLVADRDHWKKIKNQCPPGTKEWHEANARTSAYKSVVNGFYGGVGSTFSRFYNPTIAEAVTQTGVWLIRRTVAEAEARA